MSRALSFLALSGFLVAGVAALPAGCEKKSHEVKYTRTSEGPDDGNVSVERKYDEHGYKVEKKVDTDHGQYKHEEKMKSDDGGSKYEKKVETPHGDYKIEKKTDDNGNVRTEVHTDHD